MSHFFLPTQNATDWKYLLVDPERQWRTGYSARALAHCWQEANGFPLEVQLLFYNSGIQAFREVGFLLGFPEYPVSLPGGKRPSQNDLFILAKDADQHLMTMVIEGKVSEAFGPTLEEWLAAPSKGKQERLEYISHQLGLPRQLPGSIRYQLLHRSVSGLKLAEEFGARRALMLVHSFSQDDHRFDEYRAFLHLFGKDCQPNQMVHLRQTHGIDLYAGWVRGDPKYLKV